VSDLHPRLKAIYRREYPAKGYPITRNQWRVSVSLPKALLDELRQAAVEQGLSFSEIIRQRLTVSP